MSKKEENVKSPVRSGSRTRTKTDYFVPKNEIKEIKKVTIFNGKGIPLNQIDPIKTSLNRLSSDHNLLKEFHRLLYGSFGKGNERKKNIRAFNGFIWTDSFTRDKVEAKLQDKRWNVSSLRELCDLLNIEYKKIQDRTLLTEKIISFLEKPSDRHMQSISKSSNKSRGRPSGSKKMNKDDISSDNDEKKKSSKKRSSSTVGTSLKKSGKKRRSKKGTKEKDPNKPKRPLSAFFVFSNDVRSEIKKKSPSISVKEMAQELGKRWNEMKSSDRKKYEDESKKLKKKFDQAMIEYNKKQNKKNTDHADDDKDGDDDGHENEEGDEDGEDNE